MEPITTEQRLDNVIGGEERASAFFASSKRCAATFGG